MAKPDIPSDFLLTAKSIHNFAQTLTLIRDGAEADAETKLSPDQCRDLLWAMQLMREGRAQDG